jgi:hypothetical protein
VHAHPIIALLPSRACLPAALTGTRLPFDLTACRGETAALRPCGVGLSAAVPQQERGARAGGKVAADALHLTYFWCRGAGPDGLRARQQASGATPQRTEREQRQAGSAISQPRDSLAPDSSTASLQCCPHCLLPCLDVLRTALIVPRREHREGERTDRGQQTQELTYRDWIGVANIASSVAKRRNPRVMSVLPPPSSFRSTDPVCVSWIGNGRAFGVRTTRDVEAGEVRHRTATDHAQRQTHADACDGRTVSLTRSLALARSVGLF